MRTKQILTALALPALFAACTADDFESISNGAEQQRAALRKDLVLNFDGANTRFSAGAPDAAPNLVWEVGDTIGGAIIDQYAPGQGDKFPIVNYVSTNHPFVLGADGVWSIKHTMVEGHYLFYYPYNENNHERGAVKYSIPVMQDLSDPKTGKFNPKAAIERYNMAVGEQFLDKEDLNAGTTLLNLYSYARVKVTIDNHYAGGNVDKIVLKAASNEKFALNGQISNKKVEAIFSAPNFDGAVKNATTTAAFCLDGEGKNKDEFYLPELNEGSDVIVAKFPANTALKVDGQNNKSIETYVVLPAAAYGEMTVYMYMADGKVYSGEIAEFTANRNKIKGLEVTMVATEDAPYVVTSEADWNRYVSLIKKGVTAEFTIAGEDFSLSNNAKYPTAEGAKVEVTGNLKVSGNNVTMANVKAGTITVLEGAKLNVNNQITAEEIINKGKVVLTKVENSGRVVEVKGAKKITNEGELTVAKDAVAAFVLANEAGAEVENNGTMNVTGTNNGNIQNNGTMNTVGNFENATREYKGGKLVNEPTIINAKGAKILAKAGKLTNKAKIENNGDLTCKNQSGQIVNSKDDEKDAAAVLDSKAGAITYITNNEEGKVIVYSANTTNLTIAGDKGIVEYTTTKATESFKNSLVNTVIASDDLKITEGKITSLTFNDNAKLELGKNAAGTFIAEVEKLIVKGKNTTVTLGSNLTLETVEIAEKAMVVVPEGLAMTITGSAMDNKGTILVGGTFKAVNILATKGGNVEDNGGTSQITWKATPADDAETEYKNALEAMVKAWINDDARASWDDVKKIAEGSWIEGGESWKTLITTAKDRYNAWQTALDKNFVDLNLDAYFNNIFKSESKVDAIIEAYKKDGSENLGSAVAANFKNNEWIGTNVYVQETATTTFDKIGIVKGNTLKKDFAAKVAALTADKIKVSDEFGNKVVLLTARAIVEKDVKEAWIPDYSYIRTYEGAEEFDVMKALTGFKADWYVKGQDAFSAKNLNTLENVKEAAALIYDTYYNGNGGKPLGILEKTAIEELNILDKVTTILKEWKYTDKQIEALADAVK